MHGAGSGDSAFPEANVSQMQVPAPWRRVESQLLQSHVGPHVEITAFSLEKAGRPGLRVTDTPGVHTVASDPRQCLVKSTGIGLAHREGELT